ncbi:MAG: major capsid protein [Bacteroidota bacterium]
MRFTALLSLLLVLLLATASPPSAEPILPADPSITDMAGPNNPSQTRVIDPINTEVVRGYRQQAFIAMELFPSVGVGAYGGTILQFGKESFRLYSTRRSRGSDTKRVRFGYEGDPYAVPNRALDAQVAFEDMVDASAVPGIDLSRGALNLTMRAITLDVEYEAAQLATDPAKYDANHKLALAGSDKWSDPDSDPVGDIDDAKEAIRKSTGLYPNVLVLGALEFRALKEHPKLKERIKYTSRESINEEILAQLFDLPKVVVGRGVYATAEDADFTDIWSGAVLAYVPAANGSYSPSGQGQILTREEPSYGYTYAINGMPMVEQPYREQRSKSWIYGVTYDAVPVLSGVSAGFLFTGVVN